MHPPYIPILEPTNVCGFYPFSTFICQADKKTLILALSARDRDWEEHIS